jgi:hypothetical protein
MFLPLPHRIKQPSAILAGLPIMSATAMMASSPTIGDHAARCAAAMAANKKPEDEWSPRPPSCSFRISKR